MAALLAFFLAVSPYTMIEDCSACPPADPSTPCYRSWGSMAWRGNEYAVSNAGRAVWFYSAASRKPTKVSGAIVACPVNGCPGLVAADYDCPVRGVSLCDDCNVLYVWGWAMGGIVAVELDQAMAEPWPIRKTLLAAPDLAGACTYGTGEQQYLVATGLDQETIPVPETRLYRVTATGLQQMQVINLPASKSPAQVPAGGRAPAARSVMGCVVVSGELFLADSSMMVSRWAISPAGLAAAGVAPFTGAYYNGIMMQADPCRSLILTPGPSLELWDVSSNVELAAFAGSAGALAWPWLWESVLGETRARLWDISDPSEPVMVSPEKLAWLPHQAWMGGVSCAGDICAAGESISIRVHPELFEVFSDGFESGDASAWTTLVEE